MLIRWFCNSETLLSCAMVKLKVVFMLWLPLNTVCCMVDVTPLELLPGYSGKNQVNRIPADVLDHCVLTHSGRVTHICVGDQTIIGSVNGLSPDRRQTITWTNAGILLIGPLGTKISEILIKIQTFSFRKMHLKTSSVKQRPFCFGLNVLRFAWTMVLPFRNRCFLVFYAKGF